MSAWAATIVLAWLATPAVAGPAQASEAFERGVDAYRRGEYGEADALWRACLEEALPPAERARVAYDLGNAAWRREEPLVAVGWYTRALRDAPRHADAWHNLELVRAEAGLEPADRGDLRSTVDRLLGSLLPGERRLLVLIALIPLALALAGEALRGGKPWRRLALVLVPVVVLAAAPWVHGLLFPVGDTLLVVRNPSVALRTEPRTELSPIGRLEPGDEVERIDALSGWVRVETPEGTRAWVQEEALFSLAPLGQGGGPAPPTD